MSAEAATILGAVLSAGATLVVGYFGIRRRIFAELEGRYDAALRDLRLGVYPALWGALEPLAKYAREPPGRPTRGEIERLTIRLRQWYFDEGGIHLSLHAREAYFQLQDALTVVVESEHWSAGTDRTAEVNEATYEALRQIGSWLRTTLTYDVGSRRSFSLAPRWQKKAARRAAKEDLEEMRITKELTAGLRAEYGAPKD